jgi:hypothetical protein
MIFLFFIFKLNVLWFRIYSEQIGVLEKEVAMINQGEDAILMF